MKRFTRILLVVGLFLIGAITYLYYVTVLGYAVWANEEHYELLHEHTANHPLHTLWPELNKCGGNLQTMSDLLEPERGGDESVMACESHLLDRLDEEQKRWQASLDNETESRLFSIESDLLLRGGEPLSENESVLRMCDVDGQTLTSLKESIAHNEPTSEYGTQRLECIKDEKQRLQKATEIYAVNDKWPNSFIFYYFYFHPHTVWKSGPGDGWAHWEEYRHNGNIPSWSLLKALNLSWDSRYSIQQTERSNELLDKFLSYSNLDELLDETLRISNREIKLLTPIVIDDVTQAIILSEIDFEMVQGYIDDEWKSYYQIVTPAVVILIVLFLWFQHLKLGTIPKGMDLRQWQAGIWHPSLVLLHRSSDFRHRHLFNIMVFMVFIVPIFFIGEPLWGTIALLLPLGFGMVAIPRVVTDYRLFTKGIPVPCNEMDTAVESVVSRVSISGVSEARYGVTTYEANYQGRKYHIAASYDEDRRGPLIALIDPNRGEHGLLLNAFCESD